MTFDPNAPAFGPEAQKPEDLKAEEVQPVVEAVAETTEEIVKTEETSEEESKVPYSRFKKFHDEAKEARAEAERLKSEIEEWKRKPVSEQTENEEIPAHWIKLYGDSEMSKEAWKIQSEADKKFIEQTRLAALEAVKAEARAEQQRSEEEKKKVESDFETLADYAERELTKTDRNAILKIVNDYSPKDENGNYLAKVPFEKAYDIYVLQQEAGKAPKVQSRNKVASITNTRTQGAVSDDEAERNKNFNPMDWGAALRRLNN